MNIAETKNKVDSVLADRGLVREYKEQAVRLLLYHLYIAIDIYRFMTFAEKAKALQGGDIMSSESDILIIGAGITGCALARELSRFTASVTVLERASDV